MNNLSDFANFGELQIFWGAPWGGRQTEVCAPGAKNPRYASGQKYSIERIPAVGSRKNGKQLCSQMVIID